MFPKDLVQYTDMYALQTGTEKFVPCILQEMKAFFGLSILTGCLKFPRLRSTTEIEPSYSKYGQDAAVVLQLSKELEPNKHKLYCDNYFTSYYLLQILNQKSIFLAGTARLNRFSKPPLTDVKDFFKKERGSTEQIVSTDGIVVTRWLDNKPVVMVSNFVGVGTENLVKRWDRKTKSFIDVNRPEVIQKYPSMGGIDETDALIAFYRTKNRCRKWTVRLIFHAVDMALTNSWLEYKQVKVNSYNNQKRGRPSRGTSSPVVTAKRQNIESKKPQMCLSRTAQTLAKDVSVTMWREMNARKIIFRVAGSDPEYLPNNNVNQPELISQLPTDM
ncbi:hypothetical protein JTB14_030901 [Gonioctena quinquepunctata]|nr:hypothetical protein JTB14_030901 [Gonioctena quinquepunctata]